MMEAIMTQAKQLADSSDEAGRKRLIDAFRNLSYSLETPDDTLQRITYYHLQIAAVRIGVDLGLFDLLAANEHSMTVDELQKKTGAAPILIGRLLRYLASVATIAEIDVDTFGSTNVTEALAIPGNQAGIYHQFDTVGPIYQSLPAFLVKKNYQDITDNTDTAHQTAHGTPLPAFLWMAENPKAGAVFNQYMMHRRRGMASWSDVYPFAEVIRGCPSDDGEKALFVDIGGNIGHECAKVKARYPNLPGRIVLQDLPGPISQALETPGVENMVHDIFEPQPVRGSKFYYLRAVLHDWPDDECRLILRNIVAAMGADSVILIDEMVLPDGNVHWHTTQLDLTMMAALASRERTLSQWTELLASVDLKIVDTYVYTPSIYESVMHVVRK